MSPLDNLITAFWKCLRDDLRGRGCLLGEVPYAYQRHPSRSDFERGMIKNNAIEFLQSDEFAIWARLSGFQPDELRPRFEQEIAE